MTNVEIALSYIGLLIQVVGLLLFGVTSAWFTLFVIKQPEKNWQLQGIAYGVFFAFVAYILQYLTPGSYGAYLIGAAGGLIYWGLIKNREKPEKKK
jgi:hypothetical protein